MRTLTNRRSFIAAGAASLLGTRLGQAFAAAGPSPASNRKPARACILLYMAGGPSHIDTFDPKPGRPTGGEFKAIPTSVEGVQVCEHLPRLAERMKHLALIRSLTAKEGNHERARHLMHTGYAPQGGADHPSLGALVSETRAPEGMPGYVALGGPGADAGFLDARHSPFPVRNATKPVRYLAPFKGVDPARFDARVGLTRMLDQRFAAGRGGAYARSQRELADQAVALMRSPGAAAFSLVSEAETLRQAYGPSEFGQGCLMARRLVEHGVPFVEVTMNGWDTHENNFTRVRDLCAVLDQGMSALVDDLQARGLFSETLIVWTGDFGRTPRINERGGRDHFPRCSVAMLAGGGVRGGHAIGATDQDGAEIRDRPVTVPDLFRTIAHALDLNADKTRLAPSGRPIKTVDGGQVIAGIF